MQKLPIEALCKVTRWFAKRVLGECRARRLGVSCDCFFLTKPYAKLEKGIRGFRAIAPLSVFSKWCTTVLVDLLHEEKELVEWRNLHVGAVRVHAGVIYEHTAETLEWQEDRRTDLEP